MIFLLTNSCSMGCPHCMQNSVRGKGRMSDETIEKSIAFVKDTIPKGMTVILSGGEILEMSQWDTTVAGIATALFDYKILLLTNGYELKHPSKCRALDELLNSNPNISVQITNVKGIYPKYDEVKKIIKTIRGRLSDKSCIKIGVANWFNQGIVPVGRARDVESNHLFSYLNRSIPVTGCDTLYRLFIGEKYDLVKTVNRFKLEFSEGETQCKPTIRETGDICFGEYEACSSVGSVFNYKECSKRTPPSGSCISNAYQKHRIEFITGYMMNDELPQVSSNKN